MLPRRIWVLAAAGLTTALLAGCAPLRVNTYVPRDAVSPMTFHSYAWATDDQLVTGDPRLDSNRFFQERVQMAVEEQLASRGFTKAAPDRADVVLHYHANLTQKVDANGADLRYGYCDGCKPYVYDAGTLLLDVVDGHTHKLIWRGWAEGSMDGVIENQTLMEQRVDLAVTRILDRFPRRGGQSE